MDFLRIPIQQDVQLSSAGQILIAEPFLSDPNFSRTVILICEHGEEGTIGFTINRLTDFNLEDLLSGIYIPAMPIFSGGPVQADTLHMLHRVPDILGGKEIVNGIYWGGAFEALKDAIVGNAIGADDVKLLLGYSGWGIGQLSKEMEDRSWYIGMASQDVIFESDPLLAWSKAIQSLGQEFSHLVNLPSNPQLN